MDLIYSTVGFFVTGGAFMYPILTVFAIGASIAIERYITLTRITNRNQSVWSEVQPALAEGDFERARELTRENDSTIARLLTMGLDRQGTVRRREDIEIAMEEGMMEIIPQLEKRTPYVALASNIATLLGLLGTVTGIIETFQSITLYGTGDPRVMSGGISQALVTTVMGLLVAIPLLLSHSFLSSKSNSLIQILDEKSTAFVALLAEMNRIKK